MNRLFLTLITWITTMIHQPVIGFAIVNPNASILPAQSVFTMNTRMCGSTSSSHLSMSPKNTEHHENEISSSSSSSSSMAFTRRALITTSIMYTLLPILAIPTDLKQLPLVQNANAYPVTDRSYNNLPTYLTEPTEEFKSNEIKADEFRRGQILLKKQFQQILEEFTSTSMSTDKNSDVIVNLLNDMTTFIKTQNGLPLGIKKDQLVKIVRAKKREGVWPTNCEYAYQALIREINFQQSPNRDKDVENPL